MSIYKGTELIAGTRDNRANIDLTNLSTTGQAKFDAKQNALGYSPVNKAGDTMSGGLLITGGGLTVQNNNQIQVKSSNLNPKYRATSQISYVPIMTTDNEGQSFFYIENVQNTNGYVGANFVLHRKVENTDTHAWRYFTLWVAPDNSTSHMDLSQINLLAGNSPAISSLPSGHYVDWSLGASGAQYTPGATGWVTIGGNCTLDSGFARIINWNAGGIATSTHAGGYSTSGYRSAMCPVAAGQSVWVEYNNFNVEFFRFIYAFSVQ